MRRIYLLMIISVLFYGCAPIGHPLHHNVEIDKLQENGLLVGSIMGDALQKIKKKDPLVSVFYKNRYVLHIDKKLYNVIFYNGIFLVDLPPGVHEISGISYTRNSFSINQKFKILPGKITS